MKPFQGNKRHGTSPSFKRGRHINWKPICVQYLTFGAFVGGLQVAMGMKTESWKTWRAVGIHTYYSGWHIYLLPSGLSLSGHSFSSQVLEWNSTTVDQVHPQTFWFHAPAGTTRSFMLFPLPGKENEKPVTTLGSHWPFRAWLYPKKKPSKPRAYAAGRVAPKKSFGLGDGKGFPREPPDSYIMEWIKPWQKTVRRFHQVGKNTNRSFWAGFSKGYLYLYTLNFKLANSAWSHDLFRQFLAGLFSFLGSKTPKIVECWVQIWIL